MAKPALRAGANASCAPHLAQRDPTRGAARCRNIHLSHDANRVDRCSHGNDPFDSGRERFHWIIRRAMVATCRGNSSGVSIPSFACDIGV